MKKSGDKGRDAQPASLVIYRFKASEGVHDLTVGIVQGAIEPLRHAGEPQGDQHIGATELYGKALRAVVLLRDTGVWEIAEVSL